jgi:hypothetical protein
MSDLFDSVKACHSDVVIPLLAADVVVGVVECSSACVKYINTLAALNRALLVSKSTQALPTRPPRCFRQQS